MASDTRKTVEFALKLIGVDPKSLSPLISAFQDLDKIIKTSQKSVESFQKSLGKLKAPASFTKLASELDKLGKVKLKDLGPLATNLQKLSKVDKLPNIGTFVNNIATLSQTSLAGLGNLSKNLHAISKINVDATVSKLRELNTALRALEKQGGLSSFARFATDIRAMRSTLDNSQASINRMTDSLHQIGNTAQSSGLKLRSLGDKFRTVLEFRLISEGIIQAKLAITEGVAAIIEYDQALKDLQAITGATASEVEQMGRKILEVASTTKFSASEVAAGMRTLGQAGFTASEAVQTMQGVSDLATGTLSDMGQVVDLVTTAMRVFQVDASQSATVTDTFANAVNRSKLTVEKLRTSMNYVGPIAKDANVSFQELSAAMMTLANSGIRASTIGTSLRQVLSQLVAPSAKFEAAAKRVGISLQDLDPQTQSFSHVLANLRIVLKDTGTAFEIFGKRGASAALALTTQGSQYNDLLSTVSRTGTAAEMAAIQMEGLGVSFKNLRDKLGNLAITIGKAGLASTFKLFVDVARSLVDGLVVLANDGVGKLTLQITLLTVALGFFIGLGIKLKPIGLFFVSILVPLKAIVATMWGLVAAQTAWNFALLANPATHMLIGIGALLLGVKLLFDKLAESSEKTASEISILSKEYGILAKQILDTQVSVLKLEEGSTEYKNTLQSIKKPLREATKETGEFGDLAREAYYSVDDLNGKFLDGGVALEEFRKRLKELELDRAKEAFDKAANDFQKSLDRFDKESLSRENPLAKQFHDGKISLEEFEHALNELDDSELTKKLKKQKEELKELREMAFSYFTVLKDTGQVDPSQSIEGFEKFAGTLSKNKGFVSALVSEFKKYQKVVNAAYTILERWRDDPDLMDLSPGIEATRKAAETLGITLSQETQNELDGLNEITDARKKHVEDLNKLYKPSADAAYIFQEKYLKEKAEIEKRLFDDIAQQSENSVLALANDLERIATETAQKKAEIEETYKSSTRGPQSIYDSSMDSASKARAEAIVQEDKRVRHEQEEAFKKYAQAVAKESDILAKKFKSDTDSMSKEFSKIEKEAEKSWKNIPKHADDSLQAQQTAIGNWLNTVQDKMNEFSGSTSKTLEGLKNDLKIALDTGDVESFDKISKNIETVTSEGTKYFEQMGGSIDSVLDHLANKEAQLLDNIEKYAQQALNIQKQVSDFISDLDQKQMDKREKFADDRQKAEEVFRQAAIKRTEAERIGGEQGIKLREEERKLLEEGLELAKKIGGSVQNRNSIEEKIKQSRQKELEISKEINSLNRIEDAEKINRLNKQRTDEKQKQKDLQDELNLSEEQERVAKRLALQAEKEITANRKEQTETSNDLVASAQDQTKETLTLKEQIEEATTLMENIKFDIDPSAAITNINVAVSELDRFKEPIVLDFSITDTTSQKIKDIGQDIVKVGDTWTNTWSQAVGDSTEKVKDFETALKEIEDSKVKVAFDGSGSSTKPITEKIAEIKEKFENLVSKLTEEIQVHVTLPTYSDVMTKLQSIIDKLAEIKDKEITITTNYKSSGDSKPEGKQTGGLLPGYGGGDKIPLLAEAGEWIIRKEAVKKFGSSFFASLNSLRLPRFNTGGYIANAIQNISPEKTDYFAGLQDFGKVVLDTGSMQIPAMVRTDVIGEITNHLTKLRRFSS